MHEPPLLAVLPFVVLLLSIAVLPLFAHTWWQLDRNRAIVSALCAAPVVWWGVQADRGGDLVHALTYVGNGPNFMVKAIAESAGVKMPSFFGYLAFSAAVLLPLLAAVSLMLR